MHLWQLWSICGIAFLIFEMFTPSMFFLNFALAAFITAVFSVCIGTISTLIIIFFVFSFVSFAFLRPILVKKFIKDKETGLQNKYIGKTVTADEEITDKAGVINIYGERWDARSDDGSVIPSGSQVKIVRNESIIMYVQKID